MGYACHNHINDRLFQSNILAFCLYDLRFIILTIRKQIIAFKKGTFAPPVPPTERQEGHLLPSLACLDFIQLCIRIYRKFVRHSLVSKVYDRAHYGWA